VSGAERGVFLPVLSLRSGSFRANDTIHADAVLPVHNVVPDSQHNT
jgi:hypothetical protein